MKCLACGSEALVKGTVLDTSGGAPIIFKFDEVSVLKSMFGVAARGIRAYGCVNCQYLQLGVDFTEKDLRQYQQFEGVQPGVLERLNSEP